MRGELLQVSCKIDACEVIGLIQDAMDQGHGANAVSRVIERLERLRIADVSGLQIEQTRNDLQIIFHPMVHFSEQDIFLMQGGRELRFRVLSL